MPPNDSNSDWPSVDCLSQFLRKHKFKINHSMLLILKCRLEESIVTYRADRDRFDCDKVAAQLLRRLYILCSSNDPPIGQVRRYFLSLPTVALEDIYARFIRRAAMRDALLAEVTPEPSDAGSEELHDETNTKSSNILGFAVEAAVVAAAAIPIPHLSDRTIGALKNWVKDASSDDLLRLLPLLISDGGAVLKGQKRGRKKISLPHYEPQIMGRIPRLNRKALLGPFKTKLRPTGARPHKEPEDTLMQNLAIDWFIAIGKYPSHSPNLTNPFYELVLMTFAHVRSFDAKRAFRRYWDSVAASKKRKPAVPSEKKRTNSGRYAVTGFSRKRR